VIHVELQGWDVSRQGGRAAPSDWGFMREGACETSPTFPGGAGPRPGSASERHNLRSLSPTVSWPFNPKNPIGSEPALSAGQYVRMYGAIVSDEPHDQGHVGYTLGCLVAEACNGEGDLNAAKWTWSGGRSDTKPSNPARWTEMHSPDIISVLPSPTRNETVRVIAVAAKNCFLLCFSETVDTWMTPPNPRPPGAIAHADEYVSDESNTSTITEGNGFLNGASIVSGDISAHVHIAVKGNKFYGAPGKFKAIYRVTWRMPLSVSVQSMAGGSGTVWANPLGGSCTRTCKWDYAADTAVTLTATPASGSTFDGWTGACAGSGQSTTCKLRMNSGKSVSAKFEGNR